MNKLGHLSDPSDLVEGVKKDTGKQIVSEPLEAVEKAEEQVGTKPLKNKPPASNDPTQANAAGGLDAAKNSPSPTNKDTLEIVKKMYEVSDSKVKSPPDKTIEVVIKKHPKKTPEEIQKMASTRQQLLQQQHKSLYYDPTFNRPKRREEPRAGEKKEEEEQKKKQMEELEFQKKEEKKATLSPMVKQGTHEREGTSG